MTRIIKPLLAVLMFFLLAFSIYTLVHLKFPEASEFALLTFWDQMKWNLLTLVIDVVVVVIGVSYILEVRDDKKWEPARKLVSENGALAAAWMAHAAYHCFKTEGVEPQHQNPEMRVIFLRKFVNHINRFEESIHLCNAGLGKELMPLATEAVWKMKQIVPLFNYLLFAMTKQSAREAVLYEVPEKLIIEIFELGKLLRNMYDTEFEVWMVNDPGKSVESMVDFINKHHHIYFKDALPSGVKYDLLHVFDTNMLRGVAGGRGIGQVSVFADS